MSRPKAPLKVGIIGAGRMGCRHAESAASYGAMVVAVCDARIEAAQKLAAKHGAHATDDLSDLFERGLDVAVVATPPAVRLEPVRLACEHGVHLLIEKPPSLTLKVARECLTLIERADVLAACGFQLRYGSAFEKLRDMLSGQTVHLARTMLTTGYYLDSSTPPWYLQNLHSGGPLFGEAIHPLDAVRYVLGDARCLRAQAFGVRNMAVSWAEADSDNAVQVLYELDNGVLGTHMTHNGCEVSDMSFEFFGPHLRLLTLGWGNGSIKGRYKGSDIKEPVTEQSRLGVDKTGALLRAVETGDASLIRSPFKDALLTMELIEMANHSRKTGHVARPEDLRAAPQVLS